jgi:hypothetical protein
MNALDGILKLSVNIDEFRVATDGARKSFIALQTQVAIAKLSSAARYLYYETGSRASWDAIEILARVIKELDPSLQGEYGVQGGENGK